jgi:hypothetical protein
MRRLHFWVRQATLASIVIGATACHDSPEMCGSNAAGYAPDIAPANFPMSTKIDHAFYPLSPGAVFKYRDADNVITTTSVTSDTRTIMGIDTVVVHDVATTATGDLVEDTFDYFAQDSGGTVWYFGEDTKAYSGSSFSTEGSWIGGEACALPGIQMPAFPTIGFSYRQEYQEGSAEDEGQILSMGETVVTPLRTFDGCLRTKDTTALEAGVENKLYCPNFGLVSSIDLAMPGGTDKHEDIFEFDPPPGVAP